MVKVAMFALVAVASAFLDSVQAATAPVLLKDVNATATTGGGTAASYSWWPPGFTALGSSKVVFAADDGVDGIELWVTDGTATGTSLVKDIKTGSQGSNPSNLCPFNGLVLFNAGTANDGYELWRTDGTAAGTYEIKNIAPQWNSSSPSGLTVVNGKVVFAADDMSHGSELWVTDGTAAGTSLLVDICSGTVASSPSNFIALSSNLALFTANDGTHGVELWKTDGTAAGTAMVADIASGSTGSSPSNMAVVGGYAYFSANDGTHGAELWRSDGTTAGTTLVADICSGATGSSIAQMVAGATRVFFVANDGTHGAELWTCSGTTANLVKDIYPGSTGSSISGLYADGDRALFAANDNSHGVEPWTSDGTSAGTVLVGDIASGSSSPGYFGRLGTTYYFQADSTWPDLELWGWKPGNAPFKVADIDPGSAGSYPRFMVGNSFGLLFFADDGTHGQEPWIVPATSPTIATAATVTPNPVTGVTAAATVLGDSYLGEPALTYTWHATGPAAVTFSPNGTNAAKSSTATFAAVGSYTVTCDITDTASRTTTSSVTCTVNQTLTSVTVSPGTVSVLSPNTQSFSATGKDQFGAALAQQPTWTWSATGGTIDANGLFTAGNTAGTTYHATATSGSVSGGATITVLVNQRPVVSAGSNQTVAIADGATLSGTATDDGLPNNTLTVQWSVVSGPGSATFANSNASATTAAFTVAGSYDLRLTASDGALSASSDVIISVTGPPTIATAPAATPNPVTSTTSAVSILGASYLGESALTYTWHTTGTPPAAVQFSVNGTNAAKNATATFAAAGTYAVACDITDTASRTTTASLSVTVNQTLTSVTLSPTSATVLSPNTRQFSATGKDQFGTALAQQPTWTWTATGGTIDANGLFTAGTTAGNNFSVTATSGSVSGNASVTVQFNQAPVVSAGANQSVSLPNSATLNGTATDDGLPNNALTIQWAAINPPAAVTFANPNQPATTASFTTAGTYTLRLSATDGLLTSTSDTVVTVIAPVTVVQAPTASPTPVTGTQASLSILGGSIYGEPTLSYVWQAGDNAPADVVFSVNGTNTAKATTATFSSAGSYQIRCTIVDGVGNSVSATVGVSVVQTLTGITVTPASTSVVVNGSRAFAATGVDQFGATMAIQPAFVWSKTGASASISSSGQYTAGSTTGSGTVVATVGALSGSASVSVVGTNAPTITVGPTASANPVTTASTVLSVQATSPAGESALTYIWSPVSQPNNGSCSFSTNNSNAAKTATCTFTAAGVYVLGVSVRDQQSQIVVGSLSVTVNQSANGAVIVKPNPAWVAAGVPKQFKATASDQFGLPITSFTWTVTGSGTIGSGSGVFISSQPSASAVVTATAGSGSGSAQVSSYSPQVAALAAAASDRNPADPFPERRGALFLPLTPAPPNPNVIEPGRAWGGLTPAPGVAGISAPNGTRLACGPGGSLSVTVQAVPAAVVTFTSLDGGHFANGLGSTTATADSNGVATVAFTTPGRLGTCRIVAGSDGTSGNVVFRARVH